MHSEMIAAVIANVGCWVLLSLSLFLQYSNTLCIKFWCNSNFDVSEHHIYRVSGDLAQVF